ncbi:MAG: hypothetical protein JW730_02520 [Anaerolineales bacterium]|nr:hypothetical protein [Anaerolineales bacterium]
MKQLHQGLDYQLYKVYLWGGLPLVVIYIVVSVLIFDATRLPGPQAFLVILGPLLLWFAGILLYWWWVFLFKGNKELEDWVQGQGDGFPEIKSLESWSTLHKAMAVFGGSADELIRNAKRANRPVIVWYGCVNLLVIWIYGYFTLGALEILPAEWFKFMVYGVFVWIGLMLPGTYVLMTWGGKTAERTYLAPLGLAITNVPGLQPDLVGLIGGGQKLIPDGPAIVEGERHGRLVHIETIDKHSLTVVQAKMPEFKVQSDDGKLVPDKGAPEAVVSALRSLRKAKRWQGIKVNAGSEGIGIQRQSKGTNMWLYDLWLAEYLLDKTNAG